MCFSTTPGAAPALSTALPRFPAPIRPHWQATAAAKGFRILARIRDRYHLLLRCRTCRRDFPTKLFVLMRGQPLCPHCLAARRAAPDLHPAPAPSGRHGAQALPGAPRPARRRGRLTGAFRRPFSPEGPRRSPRVIATPHALTHHPSRILPPPRATPPAGATSCTL